MDEQPRNADGTQHTIAEERRAASPWLGDRPPHLPCRKGELPTAVLFPGDPGRVDRFAHVLDDFHIIGQNREFRIATGLFHGVPLGICSTGIGGPSTEIALVEAAGLGCKYALRVGGTGALRSELSPGELLLITRALRGGGAASFYAPRDVDAKPHPRMLQALLESAALGGYMMTEAVVASTDSYYLGQGRPLPGIPADEAASLQDYRNRGADALDMEAETILIVGKAMGMVTGALLAVHANRATDSWLEDFGAAQNRMITLGCEALVRLVQADAHQNA